MKITPEIIADFRSEFGSTFTDSAKWGDDVLYWALCRADSETGGSVWGAYRLGECHNFKRRGMYLFAAAALVNFFGDDPSGPVAGQARLNTAGKSVGDESTQYRVAAMMDAGDDFLTYSVFGQEFYRIRRGTMGARAV